MIMLEETKKILDQKENQASFASYIKLIAEKFLPKKKVSMENLEQSQ